VQNPALTAARIKAEATARNYPSADWAFAERIEAQVRTKELPSYRTEIGAGRELIDREMEPYLFDTVESTRITSPLMPAACGEVDAQVDRRA
jgi:hypothetical protein